MIRSNASETSCIEVSVAHDPRFGGNPIDVGFYTFFHNYIPIRDMLLAIEARGFEVYASPEHLAGLTRKAVLNNLKEFERLLITGRMTEREEGYYNTLRKFQELDRELAEMKKLDLNALRTKYLNNLRALQKP